MKMNPPSRRDASPDVMSTVGQIERKAQQRVVRLFTDKTHPLCLGYTHLGKWEEREGFEGKGNRNIEPELLRAWLKQRGHSDALIGKVLSEEVRLNAQPLAHDTWEY